MYYTLHLLKVCRKRGRTGVPGKDSVFFAGECKALPITWYCTAGIKSIADEHGPG